MLKLLKVNIEISVKGDPNDLDDLKDRVYDHLQFAMEDEDLEFSFDEEDSEEVEDES
jgi:hypothetical protein